MINFYIKRHRDIVRRGAVGFAYDVDAQILFDRMTTQPDATRKDLINDFFVGIKADLSINNLSDAFDTLYFMAGHNQSETRLNWVNSSHTLIEVNSPIWTLDRGYTGNGSTMYLDMNYNPSTAGINFTRNNASWALYFRTNIDDNSNTFGAFDGSGNTLTPRNGGNLKVRVNSASASGSAVPNSLGLFSGARLNDAANLKSYHNGTLIETFATASSAIVNHNFYILALNNSGSDFGHTTRQVAFFYAGSGTLINQANLFTRVETFLDAIGAGVV